MKTVLRHIAFATAVALAPQVRAVEVLIPSYFYPGGVNNGWPQLNVAAGKVGITAILNPNSGPGATLDTNYRSAVNSLRASGGRVIGYVSTAYAARPVANVKADIAKYKSLYALDGIFLDEMTNTDNPAALAYYRDVYGYIKSLDPNWHVTANPGTNTTPTYLQSPGTTDTLVTFENDTGYPASTPSNWTAAYAMRRFSNLAYAVSTSATMTSYINAAATTKRAGYIYVTDDSGANPWDTLPTYWSAELDAIRAVTPTWSANTSGDWKAAGAWTTPTAPNGVGREALFFGAITTPQTVYTDSDVTLGVLAFNNANRYVLTGGGGLILDASVESALIDVRRGDHTINLPLTLRDATTAFVAEGASLTIADPLIIESGASLTKTGSGTLSIISTVNDANAAFNVVAGSLAVGSDISVGSLAIASGATVRLASDVTLTLSGQTSASLRASIGSGSLTTVSADDLHRLGYKSIDGGDGFVIRLALNGDTNLDDVVDFADLKNLAVHFNKVAAGTWSGGDFDYDATVDLADLKLLAANYDAPESFAADWSLAQSLIPEPSLLGLAAAGLLLRRRGR